MLHAQELLQSVSSLSLFLIFVISLLVLSKSADIMVDQAIKLSLNWGLPPVVVGATVISLGTTLPEVVVSVMASLQGRSGIALGNAVGSIICDTGLILGIAVILGKIPLEKETVQRQAWLQSGSVILLIGFSLLHAHWPDPAVNGGVLPQYVGILFVFLLILYMFMQVKWSKNIDQEDVPASGEVHTLKSLGILLVAFIFLALSSELLIEAAMELARRMSIPESVIAVTMVAFGTSLPELITAVTAVRKGYGSIALGNVIGADILNVLLVAGLSAAVTPQGLSISAHFYNQTFYVLFGIVFVCRLGLSLSKDVLEKKYGYILLASYLFITLINLIYS